MNASSQQMPQEDVCPVCRGMGRLRRDVAVGHPDFGKDVACVCRQRTQDAHRQQQWLTLCEQYGLQRHQVLATFRPHIKGVQEAFQAVRTLSEQLEAWGQHRATLVTLATRSHTQEPPRLPQQWLLVLGPTGTGKTHLAMALANASIVAGVPTVFASLPDLLDTLRATATPERQDEYLFRHLQEVELLVLDDVGIQRSTPWADEKLYQLLNFRYNYRLPTMLTLEPGAWSVLDERIRSRCQDSSLVVQVYLTQAQDYRLCQGSTASTHVWSKERHEDDPASLQQEPYT